MPLPDADWPWGQACDAIIQSVYVTDDIDAGMARHAGVLGIGPWFVRRDFGFDRLAYRGTPGTVAIDLAIAFSGGMMIELIQQKDDAPSPYRERGPGFHHWAFGARPGQYEARFAHLVGGGLTPILDLAVAAGGRTAMFDPGPGHAGLIELIEVVPEVEALFDRFHAASARWDGRNPVRPF